MFVSDVLYVTVNAVGIGVTVASCSREETPFSWLNCLCSQTFLASVGIAFLLLVQGSTVAIFDVISELVWLWWVL